MPDPFPITDYLPAPHLPPPYRPTPITPGTSFVGPLKRYYYNARGVSFVPEGYDLFPFGERPWQTVAGDTGYSGINNPMGTFKFFDAEIIDKQLKDIHDIGCNVVRIWASYYAWRHYQSIGQTNVFLSKLGILQSLLHKHKLHVIWTFWDSIPPVGDAAFPADTDRWSAVNAWVPAPYDTEKTVGFLTSIGFAYFESIIPVLASSQATVGYEIGNELNVSYSTSVSGFIISSIKKVYELDSNPRHPIAVGTVALTPYQTTANPAWPIQNTLFSMPEVKFLTFHPYYVLSSTLQKFIYLAVSASVKYNKPIFITEGAYTVGLQPWGRFLQEWTPCAIGFTLYTGMIGSASSHVPYQDNTGLFHADGEVRVLADALPFNQLCTSGSERLSYQIKYPKLKTVYPVGDNGIGNRYTPLQGGPKSSTEGQSFIASGYDVEDVLYIIQRWGNRPLLGSLTSAGNTAILNEIIKQTEILNIFVGDFVLLSDRSLGTFGTSEAYGFLPDATDVFFTGTVNPTFTRINPTTCFAGGTCLTSLDPWYYNVTGYDASFSVMGNFFSSVLQSKGYF